jgi:hypothetical protein
LLQHSLGGAVVVARTRLLLFGELSHSKNTHKRPRAVRPTQTNKRTVDDCNGAFAPLCY